MNFIKSHWYKYIPLLTTTVVYFGLTFMFDKNIEFRIDFSLLTDKAISIFSTILGFLLTVLTILHSLDSKFIQELKETRFFKQIVNNLSSTLILSTILLFLSIIIFLGKGLFVFSTDTIGFKDFVKSVFFYLLILNTFQFLQFLIKFIYIVTKK